MLNRRHALALLGAAFAKTAGAQDASTELTRIATFEQQVTGVTVTPDGLTFVNFPRWEKDVVVHFEGREVRRPDNRKVEFSADGIALDPQGRNLYRQALTGRTLYRIPTATLLNAALPAARVAAAVERVGTTNVADGYWMDKGGRLYVTSPEDNSIKMRAADGTMRTVIQDPRLRWPDTMAEGPDGALYVTTSQIPDMAIYREKGSTRTQPYALWKFMPPG